VLIQLRPLIAAGARKRGDGGDREPVPVSGQLSE